MTWIRPRRLLSRLLGLGTTVWLCRKVGCWARSFGKLGALVLRFVHRGRPTKRIPDYGHLLLDSLYPGRLPSPSAVQRAKELVIDSRSKKEPAEALKLLGEAVLLSPPDSTLYLAKAQVHARSQDFVEALGNAEICVSLDANCAEAWLAKGQAECGIGRTADAVLSYQTGLKVEPENAELQAQLAAVRAEPPPNFLRQLRDLMFAARLGLENLFQTVEDPEKTTDAWVASNHELLDAQLGLLSQTLRVNTAVLLDSPMLCDAYEQIVYACAQLVAGAPAAFSTELSNAANVVEGLSLALRIGWHVHHSVPKLAANALVALATCPNAEDELRRRAVRHILGGMLRWLLDARPEPDREGEEVCGCSCAVPWKAAACFLERFFEPGRAHSWVREECEAWPDSAQLCQWLTLSVRDYHATPLALVGLLQLPGVAAAAMRSEAVVNFFIPTPTSDDSDGESDGDGEHDRLAGRQHGQHGQNSQAAPVQAAASSNAADNNVPGVTPAAPVSALGWSFWRTGQYVPSLATATPAAVSVQATQGSTPPLASSGGGSPASGGAGEEPAPPPQLLGDWLMASIAYLFLFIEMDVLFTVCACRALQAMSAADPNGMGVTRLLDSLWLGVPFLNKLSFFACSHTAALDLLNRLLRGPCPGVRVAATSLAHALARPPPLPVIFEASGSDGGTEELVLRTATADEGAHLLADQGFHLAIAAPTADGVVDAVRESREGEVQLSSDGELSSVAGVVAAAAAVVANIALDQPAGDEPRPGEEDNVPSWAEFYQELLNELAVTADEGDENPSLLTLTNFEEKAWLLSEHASVCILPFSGDEADAGSKIAGQKKLQVKSSLECVAVPAAWNRFLETERAGFVVSRTSRGSSGQDSTGDDNGSGSAASASKTSKLESEAAAGALRLQLLCDVAVPADIGSQEYQNDPLKRGKAVLMSRRSIRQSTRVQNWAQAVTAAEQAGAAAVIVFNNLDEMEPFRMGLFGEPAPGIPAYMVGGPDGASLSVAGGFGCDVLLGGRSSVEAARQLYEDGGVPSSTAEVAKGKISELDPAIPPPPPWPLTASRLPADVAQAWSLLEALPSDIGDTPNWSNKAKQLELENLLNRMSVPEKRVWLTRRLVRHHRTEQAPDGGVAEPPLAFVEGDRALTPAKQVEALRRQLVEGTGLGSDDLCGEFEVRFKGEQGVGSAVFREWMDTVACEAFVHTDNRLLRSYDRRQTFWPDPAAPFINQHWQLDYEMLGRLLGLALWQSCTLDLPLHSRVCLLLFGFPPEGHENSDDEVKVLAEVDEDLYKTKVRWLLDNPISDLGFEMAFTDPLGSDELVRSSSSSPSSPEEGTAESSASMPVYLPPIVRPCDKLPGDLRTSLDTALTKASTAEVALDGEYGDRLVTDENKQEYVESLVRWRTCESIMPQINAMGRGLRKVVPETVLEELRNLLQPSEIAQLLSGSGEINIDDWEQNCIYTHGLNRDSDLATWFWQVVRNWASSSDERHRLSQLLQFVTGSGRVPVGGFSELVGFNGAKHAFTLSKGTHLTPESLPMAHACICTLDIPPYKDFESCQAKMLQMLTLGRSHFDEAAGHRADDNDV